MRLKRKTDKKTEFIGARSSTPDLYRIQQRADLYCEGNLSEYVLFAALNFVPRREDFETDENKKGPRKGPSSTKKRIKS
jgi:hypothetical protein